MFGRGLLHAIFAPLCEGGAVHRISGRATLLRPAQLPAFAARDARVQAALARTLDRYGACEADTCGYVLLALPAAHTRPALCLGCPVPGGGAAVLLMAGSHAPAGDVELAAWAAAEGLEEPALARFDEHSACWGQDECAVALAVEEVARHASVMNLAAAPSDATQLWATTLGPA